MFKFLVVGCGGSGAATLVHMMDELLAEIAPYGFDKMPAGWQFVSIDVPAAADSVDGIGRVTDLGGRYVPTSPGTGSYSVLDNAVSVAASRVKTGLGELATWAPRQPSDVGVNILNGAGQMRAVGRVITLNQSERVRQQLTDAYQTLSADSTTAEMTRLAAAGIPGLGTFDPNQPPLVLVVSSMAGGAGASMALDVCRLLTLVPGMDRSAVGVFMVTPDAFDSLPDHLRGGVRANALAMLGEIVAAQMVSSEQHDLDLLSALGENVSATGRAPFMRVFPVGSRVGVSGAAFGDGTQQTLYRGLAKGLSALMLSGKATKDFVHFDLTNASPVPTDRRLMGWGSDAIQPDPLPWGAFGFASLSMGRDRYRHYAAQRLARTAAERLLEGHLEAGNAASPEAQLNARIASQWERSARDAGLPGTDPTMPLTPESVTNWFASEALPSELAQELSAGVIQDAIAPVIPQAAGKVAAWQQALVGQLANASGRTTAAIDSAAYRWAYDWAGTLQEKVIAQTEQAIARFGLPYAREFVRRVGELLAEQVAPQLATLARGGATETTRLPEELTQELAALAGRGGNGEIVNGPALVDRVLHSLRNQVYSALYSRAAERASELLGKFTAGVIVPLSAEISEQYTVLLRASGAAPSPRGLANVHTTEFALWPSDADQQVPERFGVANNEVLITSAETFGDQYERDLPRAVEIDGIAPDAEQARRRATERVVTGVWPVADGYEAPGGLLASRRWYGSGYSYNPRTDDDEGPRLAHFELSLSPAQILTRALAYVDRHGESFEAFCSLSLAEYVSGPQVPASVRQERIADLAVKFGVALNRALPLTQVNDTIVQAVHGKSVEYLFKFSDIPFIADPEVQSTLTTALREMSNSVSLDAQSVLEGALSDNTSVTRIDIFGSYRNYSPLAFSGLLAPAAEQWAATPPPGRRAFWEYRRSRPLPASLPMTDAERRAMIGGWYIANLTGRLRIPEAPYTDAVAIWDEQRGAWLDFPQPMLTPPSRFVGMQYDWLPAVLESSLIAIANVGRNPVLESLRPYDLLAATFDRGAADDGYQGPTVGEMMRDQRPGQLLLVDWLETGQVPSFKPSAVGGATKDERLEKARAWLTTIREFLATEFLPVEPGSGRVPGRMSEISTRAEAAATPIFRDLAPDIYAVTGEMLEMLERAAVQRPTGFDVSQAGAGQQMPGGDAPEAPTLSIGAF